MPKPHGVMHGPTLPQGPHSPSQVREMVHSLTLEQVKVLLSLVMQDHVSFRKATSHFPMHTPARRIDPQAAPDNALLQGQSFSWELATQHEESNINSVKNA